MTPVFALLTDARRRSAVSRVSDALDSAAAEQSEQGRQALQAGGKWSSPLGRYPARLQPKGV